MHTVVRTYSGKGAKEFIDLLEKHRADVEREMSAVKGVLNAAGWTYVAAFITSLAYFLWHVLPLILGNRDE